MLFHNREITHLNDVCVIIDNVILPRVDKAQFVGIYLDIFMTWKDHIHEVESKISKNIGIVYRIKYLLPSHILRMLYCALILPYFLYCNIIRATSFKSNIQKLIIFQKKIICRPIIFGLHFRSHTGPVFNQLKLLKLTDINLHQ